VGAGFGFQKPGLPRRIGLELLLLAAAAIIGSCSHGLVCYVTPDGAIALIDQDGRGARVISASTTTTEGNSVRNIAPAWSPDAKHVAFARITHSANDTLVDASLVVVDAAGGLEQTLLSGTHVQPFYLFWSPDSRAISLLSQVQGEDALELGIAAAGGPGGYRGVDRGAPFFWDWLKDGTEIIAHADTGRTGQRAQRISLLRTASDAPRADLPVEAGMFQAPAVSPDGRSIAYVSTDQDRFVLHVRSVSTEADRVLARDNGGAFFAFSPDGGRLAYLAALVTQPVPLGKLTIVEVKGSLSARTVKEQPVLGFFWSRNGKRLAYLVPAPAGNLDPLFLDQPNHLVLQLMGCDASSGRTWTIARFPLSRGMLGTLPFFDQYQRSSTIWSPDSRNIVFTALSADGAPGLYVVPADGSKKPRFLAAGDFAFWSPR
jgi:Tol biopolymer transport system component